MQKWKNSQLAWSSKSSPPNWVIHGSNAVDYIFFNITSVSLLLFSGQRFTLQLKCLIKLQNTGLFFIRLVRQNYVSELLLLWSSLWGYRLYQHAVCTYISDKTRTNRPNHSFIPTAVHTLNRLKYTKWMFLLLMCNILNLQFLIALWCSVSLS